MGFFMTPGAVHAVGMKSQKSCCKKEISSKGDKKTAAKKTMIQKIKVIMAVAT